MADLSITPEGAPRTFAHAAPATTVIALVVGLIVGAGAGVFAIGPMLAKRLAPAPALATVGGAAGSDARADDALPADRGAVTIHLIDNLVLNPANAGGTRFLLASVALEVADEKAAESMRERDAELRDALLRLLGGKTTEQLVDLAQREALKGEVRAAIERRMGRGAVRRLYFPQFVVQ